MPKMPPDFPFQPKTVEVNGHQMAYVEVGQGDPIVFLHGNPTSSYTFRSVLKPIAEATGRRCIAIDLLGFGWSDKPSLAFSCALHASMLTGVIEALNLKNIVLVAEDWGGFLGGYIMGKHSERFESAVFMETFLWPMTWKDDVDPSLATPFWLMRTPVGDVFSRGLNLMINKMIPEHCPISEESLSVYRDSQPTWASRKALADFPKLLPLDGHPAASARFADELTAGLRNIHQPVLWLLATPGVMVSPTNPIGLGRLDELQRNLPQMEVRDFGPGMHFLSEENPDRVIEMVIEWVLELAATNAAPTMVRQVI